MGESTHAAFTGSTVTIEAEAAGLPDYNLLQWCSNAGSSSENESRFTGDGSDYAESL